MFAIEYYGMFVRARDGLMTDSKQAAKLFETAEEACAYVCQWLNETAVNLPADRKPINVVEVEVKPVIKGIKGTYRSY